MEIQKKVGDLLKKYRHAWVFGYILIYMPWFLYLEKHITNNYYVIHSAIDDKIPFIEYFIIPYLLWFVFIASVFLYFFFTDVQAFYKFALLTFTGMTIFLVISTVMPNGLHIRPTVFARDNVFVDMVKFLYRVDTPTNVLPSLHVFNTLAACIAIRQSEAARRNKVGCAAAYILSTLIILATLFLKQHSVVDLSAAFVLAYILRVFVYDSRTERVPAMARTIKL